ncbi:MAG: DUF6807 family protein [Limisphaerales bacterium]|nr:hypothetical protein [Pedosphaera sp.]MBL6843290.1 PmoA family protein [Verrucomicrobiae bacterium]RZO67009.1 MAG: hypothetical protein EVA71_11700 [Limisphaerales bacterium]HBP54542.1 hypothetical protein [Verrucomicrobiales bacterium]HCP39206.1 hypothetical protein [Verrucomicrobiales bacterium]|tara:strand:+ start:1096 stop:2034 length:939 start_codon:yes stop_codon:yes gene_type:complete
MVINRQWKLKVKSVLILWTLLAAGSASLQAGNTFEIRKESQKELVIQIEGKAVGKYMFEHDASSKEIYHDTYKPFLHIIDPERGIKITKGPGGQFTHHRGIFLGWNRLTTSEGRFDLWHMNKGIQIHQAFTSKRLTPHDASFTSNIHWLISGEKIVMAELRKMTFSHDGRKNTIAVVDLTTRLTAKVNLELKGDPEHAGVQYRAANEINKKSTSYLFPEEKQNPRKDFDLPWVNQYYELTGNGYSVTHMNHPGNPRPTRYSAYRDYGRFGAFFTVSLEEGESLILHYRFVIRRGKPGTRESIQSEFENWIQH